jgi:hypothetical protein
LQLAVACEGEAGDERKQRGTQSEKKSGSQGGSSAKWRGMGLPLPSLCIYRSKGATLHEPRASCALTAGNGVHHRRAGPTMPKQPGVHTCADHYGAATEGPRRPVTSAPHVAHSARGCAACKARPWRTTAATTVGIKNVLVPYHVSETLKQPKPKARKSLTLERCAYKTSGSKPHLSREGTTGTLKSRGLLISSSRAGLAASPRVLQM